MLLPLKRWKIVGNLRFRKNGKFAKTFFYFLRADSYGKCDVIVAGKAVNLRDDDGIQAPCVLRLSGQKSMVEILKQQTSIK